jgi:hypothetical protein
MAKRARHEDRIRSLVTRLDEMPDDDIRKVPLESSAHAWVRRRVVEGSYIGIDGVVRHPVSTFDVWLRDEPGDPLRQALSEPSAHGVAERLLRYESGVAADIFLP